MSMHSFIILFPISLPLSFPVFHFSIREEIKVSAFSGMKELVQINEEY